MSFDTPDSPPHPPSHKWVFDRTLNIPTLLTIGAMVIAVVGFGFNLINEQDHQIERQTRRIDAVERTAETARNEVQQVKNLQSMQMKSQADQMQTMRSEFRSDLKDISNKLDALLMNSAGFRSDTRNWTKK